MCDFLLCISIKKNNVSKLFRIFFFHRETICLPCIFSSDRVLVMLLAQFVKTLEIVKRILQTVLGMMCVYKILKIYHTKNSYLYLPDSHLWKCLSLHGVLHLLFISVRNKVDFQKRSTVAVTVERKCNDASEREARQANKL